jgi:8-oxo-dGTP pyrophosphatase MutT (NUDIX family)
LEQIVKLLQNILLNLPLIAEEGEYKDKISRNELCGILKEQTLVSNDAIQVVLGILELQWSKAGLLDLLELKSGNWQFISFPASLVARSWLEVMSDKDGYWFPAGWWADQANSETHRNIITKLEELRIKGASSIEHQPIRQIYVAWGLIKFEDQILFTEREDKQREGIPHFVLPGGRLNMPDLINNLKGLNSSECLKVLHGRSSKQALDSLPLALNRELEEELGLDSSEFSVGEVLRLDPYIKLEGAGSAHALTCYEISIFPIKLNFSGFIRINLLDKSKGNEDTPEKMPIIWFKLEEVVRSQKGNKRAFIDAWREHHKSNEGDLLNQLKELPESFEDIYLINEMIDIPVVSGDPFQCGPTGHNERKCYVDLESDELNILLAMAWHRRHFNDWPLTEKSYVSLFPAGWFEIKDKELIELIVSLQEKLNSCELPLIESYDRNWFRLSVSRENLFFNGEFFYFALRRPIEDTWEIQLFTEILDSPLGKLPETVFSFPLVSENMYKYLRSLEEGLEDEDIYNDQDNMMRKHLDPLVRQAGLRKLVRTSSGSREIIPFHKEQEN